MIRFRCTCGKKLKAADANAGRQAKCSNCGRLLVVPAHLSSGIEETRPAPPLPGEEDLAFDLEPPGSAGSRADAVPESEQAAAPPPEEMELVTEAPPPAVDPHADFGLPPPPEEPPEEPPPEPQIVTTPPEVQMSTESTPVGDKLEGAEAVEGNLCPKCGTPLEEGAVLCVECGATFEEAPATQPPGKLAETGGKRVWLLLAILIPVGLALIWGAITLLSTIAGRGGRSPKEPVAKAGTASKAKSPRPSGKAGTPQEKKSSQDAKRPARKTGSKQRSPQVGPLAKKHAAEKSKQPQEPASPAPVQEWVGFADKSLAARDALLGFGGKWRRFQSEKRRPPSSWAEMGVSAQEAKPFTFLHIPDAPANHFRPTAYQTQPDASGMRYVLFSDGSVRGLSPDEMENALPRETPSGWLTPAEQAVLEHVKPVLRIVNERLPDLEVVLDGESVGRLGKGEAKAFGVSVGPHSLTLKSSGKATEEHQFTAGWGLNHEYAFPLYQNLPPIPVRLYLKAFGRTRSSTAQEKKQPKAREKTLQPERKTNNKNRRKTPGRRQFPERRVEPPRTERRLLGKGPRRDGSSEGQPEEREEDASDGYYTDMSKSDREVLVIRGPSETVRCPRETGTSPIANDWRSISAVIERSGQTIRGLEDNPILVNEYGGMEEGLVLKDNGEQVFYRRVPMGTLRIREHMAPEIIALARLPEVAAPIETTESGQGALPRHLGLGLRGPVGLRKSPIGLDDEPEAALEFQDWDYQALPDVAALRRALGDAAANVVPSLIRQLQALRKANSTPSRERNSAKAEPSRFIDPVRQNTPWDQQQGTPLGLRNRLSRQEATSGGEAGDSTLPELFAAMAVYGDRKAFPALRSFFGEVKSGSATPGRGELLLAMAQCGGSQSLSYLHANTQDSGFAAAVALAMIPNPAATKALGVLVRENQWDAKRLALFRKALPRIAGYDCRQRFVRAYVAATPAGFDSAATLNELMRIDSHALVQALAERLSAPQTETTPRSGRPAGLARRNAPSSGSNLAVWRVLGHYKNTKAVKLFLDTLAGSEAALKKDALRALGEAGDPSLLPHVAQALKDPAADIRAAAVDALLSWEHADAIAMLAEAMNEDLLLAAIPEAAPRVARTAGPAATADLLAKMVVLTLDRAESEERQQNEKQGETGRDRRGAGPIGLQRGGGPGPGGIRRGGGPGPGGIQRDGGPGPGGIQRDGGPGPGGLPRGGGPGPGEFPRLPFRKAMPEANDPAETVSLPILLKAITALGVKTPAVDEAIEKARGHKDENVRIEAYTALATIAASQDNGACRNICTQALQDSATSVRAAGVRLLKSLSFQQALPLLKQAAADSTPRIRQAAMEALAGAWINQPETIPLVVSGLRDKEDVVLAAAAQAVVGRNNPALVAPVSAALGRHYQESAHRRQVLVGLANAVGSLRNPRMTPLLITLLEERDEPIKCAAIRALGAVGDATTIRGLSRAAQSGPVGVKSAVVTALSRFEHGDAMEELCEFLSSDISDLSEGLRRSTLERLVVNVGEKGRAAEWLNKENALFHETVLQDLVKIAEQQSPEFRSGLLVIAKKHLDEPQTRLSAGEILAFQADDPAVHQRLFKAFLKAPDALAKPMEDTLRQANGPEMAGLLKEEYRRLRPTGSARSGAGISEPLAATMVERLVEAAGRIGGQDGALLLGRIAASEPAPAIRSAAIEALEATQQPRVVYDLGRLAREKDDTASEAALALARMAPLDPDVSRMLLQQLTKDPRPIIASAGADGLEALGPLGEER